MVYFCRLCRCYYFICGIIWVVDRFLLLVYMYFADKESTRCQLLILSIKYLLFMLYFNGITFLNPTVVEFHHSLLDHFCSNMMPS